MMGVSGLDGMEGSPMTVQQVFAEMIGQDGLSSEKYQVHADMEYVV